jgi:hypothetical protein
MYATRSCGNQNLNMLPHQLNPPVTEQTLSLTIHKHDQAGRIHPNDRIRRSLQQPIKPRIATVSTHDPLPLRQPPPCDGRTPTSRPHSSAPSTGQRETSSHQPDIEP